MRQLKITKKITSRDSISTAKYLQELNSIPLLTIDEEVDLSAKIKQGDDKALNRFIEGNLRFVISVAKQYQNYGESLDDLICSGNEGIIVAAKRFDSTRGFKFISYAVWWIRQSILKHIAENSKTIRIPLNQVTILNKLKRITSMLEQDLERNPTSEELKNEFIKISEELGVKSNIKEYDIDNIMISNSPTFSLDKPLGEDSGSTLQDLIMTDSFSDLTKSLDNEDLQIILKGVLAKTLTTHETSIITKSFGLFGETPRSLEEIAYEFDVTTERIRQIKEKAIRKLRYKNTAKDMKSYF